MTPLQPVFAVGSLLVLGTALTARVLQRRKTFSGYEQISEEVFRLAGALGGDIFRDEEGLGIRGNHEKWPVVVRFHSTGNSTLSIQMETAANFQMSIQGRSLPGQEGKTRISCQDSEFDSKFATMTNNPTEAKLFVRVRQVMPLIKRLCSSPASSLRISQGNLEVRETSFKQPAIVDFVVAHLGAMGSLAEVLREMPGAKTGTIILYTKKRNLVPRVAVSASLVLAFFAAFHLPGAQATGEVPASAPILEGIAPADAAQIANLSGWHVMRQSDFDPYAASWLQGLGIIPSGKMPGDFSGKSNGRDAAYVLINGQGMARVILFSEDARVYDQRYERLALAVRIPHSSLSTGQWQNGAPADSDGDGLLIVAHADDHKSGLALTLRGGKLLITVPADYQSVTLFPSN